MAGWASLIGPVLGGIFQNRAAKKAAAAQTAAGDHAYRRSLPKGVTGMFGGFSYDDASQQASMNLSPEMQAQYDALMLRAQEQAGQIQNLNPLELQQQLYAQQYGMLQPQQAEQTLNQEARLLQQGRLGSTGGAGQMQALQEAQGQQRAGLMANSYNIAQQTLDSMRQRQMADQQAALGIGNIPMQYAQLGMNLGQAISPGAQFAGNQAAGAAVGLGGVQSGMWSQLGTKFGNMDYSDWSNPFARNPTSQYVPRIGSLGYNIHN